MFTLWGLRYRINLYKPKRIEDHVNVTLCNLLALFYFYFIVLKYVILCTYDYNLDIRKKEKLRIMFHSQ